MLYAIISLAVLGGIFGVILAVANKRFAVEVDPRVEAIAAALPGANCGSCGFPGCSGFAEAIVEGNAPLNACSPGGDSVYTAIAKIMGARVEEGAKERQVAQLMCNGGIDNSKLLYRQSGITDCHMVAAHFQGPKACNYGCYGLGSCVKACPFGAITIGPDQLPVIDRDKCTGCGVCIETCPQHVLKLVGVSHLVHVRCNNKDKGKAAKEVCKVACISCKMCERNCPQDAIHVVTDGNGSIAVIDYEKCTNCGICAEKCPTKAIEKILPANECIEPQKKDESKENNGCSHCGLCQEK